MKETSRYEIRKGRLKDLGDLLRLWHKFMKLHDNIIIKRNKKLQKHLELKADAKEKFQKYAKRMIYSRKGIVFVVIDNEDKGKIIGYTLSFIKKNIKIYRLEKIGYISDMYIEPAHHGKGISTRLLKENIAWFKSKNLEFAELTVFSDNKKAQDIYKHWGFFDYNINMRKKI